MIMKNCKHGLVTPDILIILHQIKMRQRPRNCVVTICNNLVYYVFFVKLDVIKFMNVNSCKCVTAASSIIADCAQAENCHIT